MKSVRRKASRMNTLFSAIDVIVISLDTELVMNVGAFTSFIVKGLIARTIYACVLLTAAAPVLQPKTGWFGFRAPGIFLITRSNRGSCDPAYSVNYSSK